MRHAFEAGVNVAGADRLLTMHKVSFTQLLPASYENRIRSVDGVVEVSPQTWFGAWYQDERNQIPAFPVKPEALLRMYPEWVVPEDQKQAWLADRSGIMIGRALADLYGWKPGDSVPLNSAIWRNNDGSYVWPVTVRAIFDVPRGRRHAQSRHAPGILRGGQGIRQGTRGLVPGAGARPGPCPVRVEAD